MKINRAHVHRTAEHYEPTRFSTPEYDSDPLTGEVRPVRELERERLERERGAAPQLKLRNRPWEPGIGRFLEVSVTSRNLWTPLHHELVKSKAFISLGRAELHVLMCLMSQFNGSNNGKLEANLKRLRDDFDWGNSPGSLSKAISNLTAKHLITQAEKPTPTEPAKYELTWLRNRKRSP